MNSSIGSDKVNEAEPNVLVVALTALFGTLLSVLGWHGRVQAGHVTDLRDRTARLEERTVKIEDIRKVLREEVGIHIRAADHRITTVEQTLERLSGKVDDMQSCLPRRAGDRREPNETS